MRILVLLVVVLFGLIAAAVALDLDLSKLAHLFKSDEFSVARTTGDDKPASSRSETKTAEQPADQVTTMSAPEGFDIARVTPGGVSVFAGRTDPKSDVTVMANGQPIGSVKSDANGEWVLVSEHKFPNSEPELSVKPGNLLPKKPDVKVAAAEPERSEEAGQTGTAKTPDKKKPDDKSSTAKRVTSELIKDLEGLVEEARREKQPERTAVAPASETAAEPNASAEQVAAEATGETPTSTPSQSAEAQTTTADAAAGSDAQKQEVAATDTSAQQESAQDEARQAEVAATPAVADTGTQPEQAQNTPAATEETQVAAASVAAPASTGTGAAATANVEQAAPAVNAEPQPDATSPSTAASAEKAVETTVAAATPEHEPSQSTTAAGSDDDSLPVPIKFIYREATFTDEGKRAAELLLEYLKLKRFKLIRLSGHADERGTQELNLDLSKERLKTVETFLRQGGFEGEMQLTPKGESEPFSGVDRTKFSRDDLYELDRRVELHLPR